MENDTSYKRYCIKQVTLGVLFRRLDKPESALEPDVFHLGHYHYFTYLWRLPPCSSTRHNIPNMPIAFHIWLSVIELLLITLSSVVIVVYGIVALCMPDTKTAGVLTIVVDISIPFTALAALTPIA